MKLRLPIRYWSAMWINLLVIPLAILISILYYSEFRAALDKRVLLQLTSIKQLKRVQIQEYLTEHLSRVEDGLVDLSDKDVLRYDVLAAAKVLKGDNHHRLDSSTQVQLLQSSDSIYDLSHHPNYDGIRLAFKTCDASGQCIFWSMMPSKIQEILLERTGMGETGETYLVGADSTLRSRSRFFPKTPPLDIHAHTTGVQEALKGIDGTGIFHDYRGVKVYSSYGPLQFGGLRWIILSEIDEEEAMAPLQGMQRRLILIFFFTISISIAVSLRLALQLTKPMLRMKESLTEMARGNYRIKVDPPTDGLEIEAMFDALKKLLQSINQAKDFATDIGEMKLDSKFEPLSDADVLGKSLIHMRDQLTAFNEKEKRLQLAKEKALLEGQEREQTRLSRELHDGLGPLLTSLKLIVQRTKMDADSKARLKDLLDSTINEVRRMTYNLMPQSLLDFGVGHAVTRLVALMQSATEVTIRYANAMNPNGHLPIDINVGLYRIAQEALTNAIKHASGSEIRLSLTEFDDRISFFIQDHGRGFDTSAVYSGLGLVNMKERCRILKGTFHLSSDTTGTRIEIEIPIHHA